MIGPPTKRGAGRSRLKVLQRQAVDQDVHQVVRDNH